MNVSVVELVFNCLGHSIRNNYIHALRSFLNRVCNYGHIIVTGSTDETVFIVDARPTTELNVFGYTSKYHSLVNLADNLIYKFNSLVIYFWFIVFVHSFFLLLLLLPR